MVAHDGQASGGGDRARAAADVVQARPADPRGRRGRAAGPRVCLRRTRLPSGRRGAGHNVVGAPKLSGPLGQGRCAEEGRCRMKIVLSMSEPDLSTPLDRGFGKAPVPDRLRRSDQGVGVLPEPRRGQRAGLSDRSVRTRERPERRARDHRRHGAERAQRPQNVQDGGPLRAGRDRVVGSRGVAPPRAAPGRRGQQAGSELSELGDCASITASPS